MRVARGTNDIGPEQRGSIAAIGNFDGVHRGHRQVIAKAQSMARARGVASAVVTFEPHPRDVVPGTKRTARLSPLSRKLALFREIGLDQAFVLPFNTRLMATDARTFVRDILIDSLGLSGTVCGTGFRFGHKRAGTADLLQEVFRASGGCSAALPAQLVDATVCSSSAIRDLISQGRIAAANQMLGYEFETRGIVVEGDRRGRDLGFPTANIVRLPARLVRPSTGIYVVRARLDDKSVRPWWDGVASLGFNPTFGGGQLRLEVHILDRDGLDLYDKRLRIAFVEKLRDEARYDNAEALVAQIRKDCDQARRIFEARRSQPEASSPES